jgi:hypothetical protein
MQDQDPQSGCDGAMSGGPVTQDAYNQIIVEPHAIDLGPQQQVVCTPVTAFFSRMVDPFKLSTRGDMSCSRESEDGGGFNGAAAKMFGVRQAGGGTRSQFRRVLSQPRSAPQYVVLDSAGLGAQRRCEHPLNLAISPSCGILASAIAATSNALIPIALPPRPDMAIAMVD